MALVNADGGFVVPLGFNPFLTGAAGPGVTNTTIDAANEAIIFYGQIITSDGGSHTIDTTGSSSIGWRAGTTTFANGGTTVKVGIGTIDAATGPPARATNAADVITFDVAAVFTGGGGGITTAAWNTSVPTTGTKTIANGDFVAIAIQMTARGGADSVVVPSQSTNAAPHRPGTTSFTGGSYAAVVAVPMCVVTFSDGALGWFYGSTAVSAFTSRTWNSGDATKEYGQLFKLPFPTKIYGLYGHIAPTADCDVILYSDPLGTPVAEKTVSIDGNVVAGTGNNRFEVLFSTPYTTTADQNVGAVFKPGGSNVSTSYKTIGVATHRITDLYGTDGYGISRASGAFADANSGLDHYQIGLLVGAFENGAGGSGGVSRARSNGGIGLC